MYSLWKLIKCCCYSIRNIFLLAFSDFLFYCKLDFPIESLQTAKLAYLHCLLQMEHAWVVCTQALSVFRSKSPSVCVSLVCQCAHKLVSSHPPSPHKQTDLCTQSNKYCLPILRHSTPWRKAGIDRQHSFSWSIVSFSVFLSLSPHVSDIAKLPVLFLIL